MLRIKVVPPKYHVRVGLIIIIISRSFSVCFSRALQAIAADVSCPQFSSLLGIISDDGKEETERV